MAYWVVSGVAWQPWVSCMGGMQQGHIAVTAEGTPKDDPTPPRGTADESHKRWLGPDPKWA